MGQIFKGVFAILKIALLQIDWVCQLMLEMSLHINKFPRVVVVDALPAPKLVSNLIGYFCRT